MTYTSYIGAEGVAELEGQTWIREATEEEVTDLLQEISKERGWTIEEVKAALNEDKIGRPYWPMTLIEDAPEAAKMRFQQWPRMVRVFP